MLSLTRKIGQKIVISDDVFCTVLGIKGNQVKLGFEASIDVAIHREEIYLKIKQQEVEHKQSNHENLVVLTH